MSFERFVFIVACLNSEITNLTTQSYLAFLKTKIVKEKFKNIKNTFTPLCVIHYLTTGIRARSESKQIQDLGRINTQKISSIKIPTFDKTNYTLWKKKMLLFIRMANPLYIQILKKWALHSYS